MTDFIHSDIHGQSYRNSSYFILSVLCSRSGYVVQVPLGPSAFQCLPKELQRGQTIKIVPVLFNIGINEQATIADR